ncbi:MAG: hypothetical protein RL477_1105 [Pseudomonadota bacterium]
MVRINATEKIALSPPACRALRPGLGLLENAPGKGPATQDRRTPVKKIILIAIAAIVAVIIGAVVFLGANVDRIVKAGVETYGPRFTGTQVRLGGVSSSLVGGEVTIKEFFLGNPQGFKTAHAFKVDRLKVVIDTGSLAGDVIHIKEIVIDAPDIIYEMGGGSSNLQAIQNNVARAAGGGGKSESSGGPSKKVVIDNLHVRNAKAALSAGILGGKVVPLPIPDIHLKDIGKEKKGASMSEASKQVLDSITKSVTSAAAKIDLKGMAEGAGKAIGDAAKGAGDAAKGVGDQLKGIFGK